MDLTTYTQIILPFKDRLYRVAWRMLRDGPEAEDVVQEVLVKLWQQRSTLDGIHNLEAWMTRLTKNKAIDRLRSKHTGHTDLDAVAEPVERAATPYQRAASNDSLTRIRQLMQSLPAAQRDVLELRDIENLPYQEIADTLDLSLQQVKVYLYRARKKMQRQLTAAGMRQDYNR